MNSPHDLAVFVLNRRLAPDLCPTGSPGCTTFLQRIAVHAITPLRLNLTSPTGGAWTYSSWMGQPGTFIGYGYHSVLPEDGSERLAGSVTIKAAFDGSSFDYIFSPANPPPDSGVDSGEGGSVGDSGGGTFWNCGGTGGCQLVAVHSRAGAGISYDPPVGEPSNAAFILSVADPIHGGDVTHLLGDLDASTTGCTPGNASNGPLPGSAADDPDCDGLTTHGNGRDNCPLNANADALDTDGDGTGDACDNCTSTWNPNQSNCNADLEILTSVAALGDACDPNPCPTTTAQFSSPPPGISGQVSNTNLAVGGAAALPTFEGAFPNVGVRWCSCSNTTDTPAARAGSCRVGCPVNPSLWAGDAFSHWKRITTAVGAAAETSEERFSVDFRRSPSPGAPAGARIDETVAWWDLSHDASALGLTGPTAPGIIWTHTDTNGDAAGSQYHYACITNCGDPSESLATQTQLDNLGSNLRSANYQVVTSLGAILGSLVLPPLPLPHTCEACRESWPYGEMLHERLGAGSERTATASVSPCRTRRSASRCRGCAGASARRRAQPTSPASSYREGAAVKGRGQAWRVGVVLSLGAAGCPARTLHRSDAALDVPAPRDALSDGARGDGADGADVPVDVAPAGDAGWVPYAWAPAGCVLAHATVPGALRVPTWQVCADGQADCQELVVAWGSATPAAEYIGPGNAGWHDGTRGWLLLDEQVPDGDATDRLVAVSTDGTLVGAWRYSTGASATCGLGGLTLGDGAYAFSVATNFDPAPWLWAPLRGALAPGAPERVGPFVTRADLAGLLLVPQDAALSATLYAALSYGGGAIVAATADAGWLAARSTATSYVGAGPSIVGSDLFYPLLVQPAADGGLTSPALVQPRDGGAYTLVAVPGGDVLGVRTDGHDLVWIVGFGRRGLYAYDRLELWASPFTLDPAAVVPRYVGPIDAAGTINRAQGVLGGGYFVALRMTPDHSGQLLRVYRLADGAWWDVHTRAGATFYWGDLLYAASDEFAVELGRMGDPPNTAHTILRQRYDGLGPPSAPMPRTP